MAPFGKFPLQRGAHASIQPAPLLATPSEELALGREHKQIVQVGFYLNRRSEVSQRDGTIEIDGWFWFRWRDKKLRPYATFEIVNGDIEERIPTEVMEDEGSQYSSVRIRAKVYQSFNVERYPFDNHTISIANDIP